MDTNNSRCFQWTNHKTQQSSSAKCVRKNRENTKSKQEEAEVLHDGVGLHTTAHGGLILLQMDIPEKSSARGDPHDMGTPMTRGEQKCEDEVEAAINHCVLAVIFLVTLHYSGME